MCLCIFIPREKVAQVAHNVERNNVFLMTISLQLFQFSCYLMRYEVNLGNIVKWNGFILLFSSLARKVVEKIITNQ